VTMSKRARILLIVATTLTALGIALVLRGREIVLLAINASAGCYPWSPKVVPYHDDMMLCPGQQTHVPIRFERGSTDRGI